MAFGNGGRGSVGPAAWRTRSLLLLDVRVMLHPVLGLLAEQASNGRLSTGHGERRVADRAVLMPKQDVPQSHDLLSEVAARLLQDLIVLRQILHPLL